MSAAFDNFPVKRSDCSARAIHPDSNKTGPDKVLDEKGSHKVELDDGFIRERKFHVETSKYPKTLLIVLALVKQTANRKFVAIHMICKATQKVQVNGIWNCPASMKARCTH